MKAWETDKKRFLRAERLLLKAEAEDARKAQWESTLAERDRLKAERETAKQLEADKWNSVFKSLELPLKAQIQTTTWDANGPDPEIWIHSEKREAGWAELIKCLEKRL